MLTDKLQGYWIHPYFLYYHIAHLSKYLMLGPPKHFLKWKRELKTMAWVFALESKWKKSGVNILFQVLTCRLFFDRLFTYKLKSFAFGIKGPCSTWSHEKDWLWITKAIIAPIRNFPPAACTWTRCSVFPRFWVMVVEAYPCVRFVIWIHFMGKKFIFGFYIWNRDNCSFGSTIMLCFIISSFICFSLIAIEGKWNPIVIAYYRLKRILLQKIRKWLQRILN